ncbi:MAG TPA: hypothetical protein VFO83_10420, partial [Aggregicoccus sp.]|nr:hypothetical protein [Aggregicoccus sp.]
MYRPLLSLLLLPLLLCTSCMIMVEPPEPPPRPLPPPPALPPIEEEELPPAPWASVDQLWLVRVDRGLVNLAEPTQALLKRIGEGLDKAGLGRGNVVVASLYDGQLLWAGSSDGLGAVKLSDALAHHGARFEGEAPTACSTSALGQLGQSLPSAELHYPPELGGGTARPFAYLSEALLVGVLDSGSPPLAPSDPACALYGESPAQWFGAHDPVRWLSRPDGAPMPRARTLFALVGTGEDTDTSSYRQSCLAQPGF